MSQISLKYNDTVSIPVEYHTRTVCEKEFKSSIGLKVKSDTQCYASASCDVPAESMLSNEPSLNSNQFLNRKEPIGHGVGLQATLP